MLRVFENRVLTKIFGPKSDGFAGDWMRLCEELYNLELLNKYYSGDQIKKNKKGRACDTYGGKVNFMQGFGCEA